MSNSKIKIRKAIESDNSFAITPEVVRKGRFRQSVPDFYCVVAEDGCNIVGIPAVYLNELYVNDGYRGQKIEERLMNCLCEEVKTHGFQQIKWTVAPWNDSGKKFYERLGAKENTEWLNYEWDI